jgi:hypothetical protein
MGTGFFTEWISDLVNIASYQRCTDFIHKNFVAVLFQRGERISESWEQRSRN